MMLESVSDRRLLTMRAGSATDEAEFGSHKGRVGQINGGVYAMSETMEVYGRISGSVYYHFGPKEFDADWGGAFTALEIMNLPTSWFSLGQAIGSGGPGTLSQSGAAAESLSLRRWLQLLQATLISPSLNSIMISGTNERSLWVDEVLPSQLIVLSGASEPPSKLIANALVRMRLSKWGIVRQLTLALSEFQTRRGRGNRSVSVFLTV